MATTRTIETNGIHLSVTEQGAGPPVVLCHGFPELAFSWRHQIPALAAAGFHVIAPDQRGYGASAAPEAIEAYDVEQLTADLTGLLDAYGYDRAIFVGHDWGALVCWMMPLLHPERVQAVACLSVPFNPRPSEPPTERMKRMFGDTFFYMLYFQRPGPADEELAADVRRSLRMFLWTVSGEGMAQGAWRLLGRDSTFLDALTDPGRLPGWISQDEFDVFAEAFERSGFTGPLNWYRNIDRNWQLTERVAKSRVGCPALFVGGELDPVLRFIDEDAMRAFVPDLEIVMLPGAGHWTQQERPAEVTEILTAFCRRHASS